ncbi:unnamed protein product [Plutella xylostella]|uniref:(diamondback moth) hypothetical protein n=1 Tax=Plutella xylostella TaxID=51655 RepID=A0A8S4DFZ7_PLUXY|nr:unnamed protein product [Plutella xylostella]
MFKYILGDFRTQLPDDGSGALRVWRVRHVTSPDDTTMTSPPDHSVTSSQDRSVTSSLEERPAGALVDVPQPQAAVFFDRDCYIVLYTYHAPTGDQSILYYWMGGSSPNDLRNLGAKEAKDLYVKLGRLPVQAWVYQGKEPAHFLQIFKGRMITYVGSATDYDLYSGARLAELKSRSKVPLESATYRNFTPYENRIEACDKAD